ncbi:MAG: hypothetical protein AAGF12_30220 [Myxococcota bacterium]
MASARFALLAAAALGSVLFLGGCADDPDDPGLDCQSMGQSCSAGESCCAGLMCIAGRLCGTATTDGGSDAPTTACGNSGDDCSGGQACCAGLMCVAGRFCGGGTDGGTPGDGGSDGAVCGSTGADCSAGQACCAGLSCVAGACGPAADGGMLGDAAVDARPDASGMCAGERVACDVDPCCAGLMCTPTDLGMECRAPRGGN